MPTGVLWPGAAEGAKVSTTATGKAIWMAAARAAGPAGAAIADRIQKVGDWRHQYPETLMEIAKLQAADAEACVAVSRAGLEAAHEQFQFVSSEGDTAQTLRQAATSGASKFHTYVVQGGQPTSEAYLPIPLNRVNWKGDDAATLVAGWAAYGSAEQSAADAVRKMCSKSGAELGGLLADRVFVLLGATSAAGPALPLLRAGATVAAVARRGAKLNALIDAALETPGKLLVPCTKPAAELPDDAAAKECAGADVIGQVPEIVSWAQGLEPGKQMTVGCYIYLDGEAHVRATMGMDVICEALLRARPGSSLAYLCSPATAHVFPTEAHAASAAAYDEAGVLARLNPLRLFKFVKNAEAPVNATNAAGEVVAMPVFDGYSVMQGPNYALAKTLQHWRAIVARADGAVVSAKMGPPMYTESMVHVDTLRIALNGMQGFAPLAAFQPDTAAAVLTMLLLRDVTDETAPAHPGVPLTNPMEVLSDAAFHGGCWRCAYKQNSIGAALWILGQTLYRAPPAAPPSAPIREQSA
eukprot:TRINITY_DN47279_c0_g1_i1.p1 TRINITY_DN47279_c0_g1~~TRINITY_DN47279_c0_g1_i1.p1  ORF type:complete len:549 (+),score=171.12 TRINITY_DN47279_c0_g1_i1:70-1647(+)